MGRIARRPVSRVPLAGPRWPATPRTADFRLPPAGSLRLCRASSVPSSTDRCCHPCRCRSGKRTSGASVGPWQGDRCSQLSARVMLTISAHNASTQSISALKRFERQTGARGPTGMYRLNGHSVCHESRQRLDPAVGSRPNLASARSLRVRRVAARRLLARHGSGPGGGGCSVPGHAAPGGLRVESCVVQKLNQT